MKRPSEVRDDGDPITPCESGVAGNGSDGMVPTVDGSFGKPDSDGTMPVVIRHRRYVANGQFARVKDNDPWPLFPELPA